MRLMPRDRADDFDVVTLREPVVIRFSQVRAEGVLEQRTVGESNPPVGKHQKLPASDLENRLEQHTVYPFEDSKNKSAAITPARHEFVEAEIREAWAKMVHSLRQHLELAG